jgi:PII-like signaling protein
MNSSQEGYLGYGFKKVMTKELTNLDNREPVTIEIINFDKK